MKDDTKDLKPSLARLGSHGREQGEQLEPPRGRMVFKIVPLSGDTDVPGIHGEGIPLRMEYELTFVPGPDLAQ